jgi:hypothetical protein
MSVSSLAHELQVERLDEPTLDLLDPAAGVHPHREELRDDVLRHALVERPARVPQRKRDRRERGLPSERLQVETRPQPFGQEVGEAVELCEVLLPDDEDDSQERVLRDRLRDLPKEGLLLLLPARRPQGEHRLVREDLLELIEDDAARCGRIGCPLLQVLVERHGREAGPALCSLPFLRLDAEQRREHVEVLDRVAIDVVGDGGAYACEWKDLKSLGFELLRDLSVEQRALARTGLRVHEDDGVADDERDDLLRLPVAPEEASPIVRGASERARPHVGLEL